MKGRDLSIILLFFVSFLVGFLYIYLKSQVMLEGGESGLVLS